MSKTNQSYKITALTAFSLVVANMIGTGAFTSLGFQLVDLQNPTTILILWSLGGLIALSGAFSYAEIGTQIQKSGGEYAFLSKLFHPLVGYLSGWISIKVGFAAPIALSAMAFVAYFPYFNLNPKLASILLLGLITLIHTRNLKPINMSKKIFILSAVLLISTLAFSQHKNDEKTKSNSANEYMHQSSTDDLIKRFESKERDEYQKPEKVLKYLGDIKGKKIMDIGAGSGYFSVKLAGKGAQVIASDVSDEFQNALKKRIEDNNLKNIELRKIPYDSPSLADEEVDMVLIVNTYHHIENRSDYFSKVKKGTKKNGELVIIDYYKA